MDAGAKRFAVALSFPGGRRGYVSRVAEALRRRLGDDRVFYDGWYESELARIALDDHLQHIYLHQADLIAVFLAAEYAESDWCALEWRAVRALMQSRPHAVMPLRFDGAVTPGFFDNVDGFLPIADTQGRLRAPDEIAELIFRRWRKETRSGPGISGIPEPSPRKRDLAVACAGVDQCLTRIAAVTLIMCLPIIASTLWLSVGVRPARFDSFESGTADRRFFAREQRFTTARMTTTALLPPGDRAVIDAPPSPDMVRISGAGGQPVLWMLDREVSFRDLDPYCSEQHRPVCDIWRGVPSAERDAPLHNVSYNDALCYLQWLAEQVPGVGFRLPTHPEWYAALSDEQRGWRGDLTRADRRAVIGAVHSRALPAAEAHRQGEGAVRHLVGNVAEWLHDPARTACDQDESPATEVPVLCGSYASHVNQIAVALDGRCPRVPGSPEPSVGFRFVGVFNADQEGQAGGKTSSVQQ